MRNHEKSCNEAGVRISRLAVELVPIIGDVDAAGVLIGSGATVLLKTRGVEFTADYLHMLADEIDQAGDDPMAGSEH